MPEMSTQESLARDRQHVMRGWGSLPINVVKTLGSKFWDSDGKEYLDMISQTAGPATVGHCHPKVVAAIEQQVRQSMHVLTVFANEPRTVFAEKLAAVAPGNLKNNCTMYISSGGSEANETALKLAMLVTGKNEVVSTYNGYHGQTLALMGLMGRADIRSGPWPLFPGFSQIPNAYCYRCYFNENPDTCDLPCADALDSHIQHATQGKVAAFIQELIPGNGGHQVPPKSYFKRIREICDKHHVLYIADEVQTGVGRTGKWWACDHFDLDPDILVTSKGIGGGLPIAATVVRKGIVPESVADSPWHIFTFGGSPLCCAAGAATIDVVNEEGLVAKAARQGERIAARLQTLMETSRIIGDVRAVGLFIGVEIVKDKTSREAWNEGAKAVSRTCLNQGVLYAVNAGAGVGNVVKMKPPLVISDEEVDRALDVFENAVASAEKGL